MSLWNKHQSLREELGRPDVRHRRGGRHSGAIVEIAPTLLPSTTRSRRWRACAPTPLSSSRGATSTFRRGLHNNCHSQQVRPPRDEVKRYGPLLAGRRVDVRHSPSNGGPSARGRPATSHASAASTSDAWQRSPTPGRPAARWCRPRSCPGYPFRSETPLDFDTIGHRSRRCRPRLALSTRNEISPRPHGWGFESSGHHGRPPTRRACFERYPKAQRRGPFSGRVDGGHHRRADASSPT